MFVDRDGTLNPDLHYLKDPDRLEVFRGVGEALSLAREHGYRVICVTNQSGVDRGFYAAEDVERVHARLNQLLRPHRAAVDAFYYCPHAPERGCRCRKPGTLLFERARDDWSIDFERSAIVGDRSLDIEAGSALGLVTALALGDRPREDADREVAASGVRPTIVTATFRGAVLRVLARG